MTPAQHLERWKNQAEATLERLAAAGAEIHSENARGSDKRDLIPGIEKDLPDVLRAMFARGDRLTCHWSVDQALVERWPPGTAESTWGGVDLSLAEICAAETSRRGWVKECFANPDDAYDVVWHGKFAFHRVPNGDCLAVPAGPGNGPVTYLSHDDGEGHGAVLAPSFVEFVDRWSQLAFVGPEDWLMLPFMGPGGLDPAAPAALAWRTALGLV